MKTIVGILLVSAGVLGASVPTRAAGGVGGVVVELLKDFFTDYLSDEWKTLRDRANAPVIAGQERVLNINYEVASHTGYDYHSRTVSGQPMTWESLDESIGTISVNGVRTYTFLRTWRSHDNPSGQRLDGPYMPSFLGRYKTRCRQVVSGVTTVDKLERSSSIDLFLLAKNFNTDGYRGLTIQAASFEVPIPDDCPGATAPPSVETIETLNLAWNSFGRLSSPREGYFWRLVRKHGLQPWK